MKRVQKEGKGKTSTYLEEEYYNLKGRASAKALRYGARLAYSKNNKDVCLGKAERVRVILIGEDT